MPLDKDWNYYQNEVDRLDDPGEFMYAIQIWGGNGTKTNHMNITREQLAKIREVLGERGNNDR